MSSATDATCRNMKVLHRWFAVSSVLLLGATIWMLADDHFREWKTFQRVANDIEIRMTEWRQLQFQTQQHVLTQQALADAVRQTRRQPLDPERLAEIKDEVHAQAVTSDLSFATVDRLAQQLVDAAGSEAAEAIRIRVLDDLTAIISNAGNREAEAFRRQKSIAGKRDATIADLSLLVRDGRETELARQQARVDQWTAKLEEQTSQYEQAKAHRERMDQLFRQLTLEETQAVGEFNKSRIEFEKLQSAVREQQSTYFVWYGIIPLPGKKFLELPILDAFNSPRKIENLWSEGLEIDYGHRKVRRFDRCTTCHQTIDKTLPGTTDQPAYECEREIRLVLDPSSGQGVEPSGDAESNERAALSEEEQQERLWGFRLAAEGLLDAEDLTVCYVRPQSPAAHARVVDATKSMGLTTGRRLRESLLQPQEMASVSDVQRRGVVVGDIIVGIDNSSIGGAGDLIGRLRAAAQQGEEIEITVRRGLPHPYGSHPRLDLYVGSLSPHPKSVFACSVCHEGQGSATAFKWSSHSPDSESQRREWERRYGWFDNAHWMYPMHPARFAESSCLKCHHDVAQLNSSTRFPAAAAPKLLRGYQLVRTYGCFGCHEINGFASGRQVGPDVRVEPNWHAAAMQLKNDPVVQQWPELQQGWVEQLIQHPDRDDVRRRILDLLTADANSEQPELARETRSRLLPVLKDVEMPGQYRKRGPSLHYVANKLQREFLVDFIQEPRHFRPTSRMPQFFGLRKHLEGEGRALAEAYEPIEVLAMATYLQRKTPGYAYVAPPQGIRASTREEKVARGRVLFQERGCLACHTHADFAEADVFRDARDLVQGPDLSGLAPKLSHPEGRKWLYSWIKQPTRYHPRTLMPETFLDPIQHEDGSLTDPAGDIVEYLLAPSANDWAPRSGGLFDVNELKPAQRTALDELTLDGLRDAFSLALSTEFLVQGIPAAFREELKGAEVELLVADDNRSEVFRVSAEQKLIYVGRKAIARRGCAGCHDIRGMENTKPIGPALSDWGRKDESQLAFESVVPYLENAAHQNDDPVPGFFLHQILSGHRTGFIYQKLREPRGYDYRRTENKRYSEWLRMPQFDFTPEEREAIITFVLGLVSDPPTDRYVYQPDPHREAIIAGEKLLDEYRCNTCHVLEPQQWQLAFQTGEFGPAPRAQDEPFPFLAEHIGRLQRETSLVEDELGNYQSVLTGMPVLSDDGLPRVFYDFVPVEDDEELDTGAEDFETEYMDFGFQLWQTAALEGETFSVGLKPAAVDASGIRLSTIAARRPARGGFLSKYLLPHVVAREKRLNPNANGAEAWGWLPPPLRGEGAKVQSDWLHDFLLNPYSIRPAVVMRMPRYNMSPKQASDLVRYFAAVDNADYPYEYQARRQSGHLAAAERRYEEVLRSLPEPGDAGSGGRLDHAMRIVTDKNYCIKCHIVGDFVPETSDKVLAPDLALVYRRLRPEYVQRWIARPASILPYTGMPVNIPYSAEAENLGGVSQDLYHGTSIEQLDAVVDLLMNFDEYAKQRITVGE